MQQQSDGATHGLAIQEPAFGSVILHVTDGFEELVTVSHKVVELLDVASGTHGLAVALIIHPEHTIPCCGHLDPTFCQATMFPTIR